MNRLQRHETGLQAPSSIQTGKEEKTILANADFYKKDLFPFSEDQAEDFTISQFHKAREGAV